MATKALLLAVVVCYIGYCAAYFTPEEVNAKLVVTVDGKSYFSEEITYRNWTDALAFCKSMNLKQATITSVAQGVALRDAISADFIGRHWTSGRDALTYRQFSWDQTKEEVRDYVPYQQIYTGESCLAYAAQGNGSYVYNLPCSTEIRTLCET